MSGALGGERGGSQRHICDALPLIVHVCGPRFCETLISVLIIFPCL